MKIPRSGLSRRQIEDWLEKALVPVEPSPAFVRHLRARLIQIEGDRLLSPWMLIVVMAAVIVMIATWFGVAVRLVLGLLSLIGLVERSQKRGSPPALAPVPLSAAERTE